MFYYPAKWLDSPSPAEFNLCTKPGETTIPAAIRLLFGLFLMASFTASGPLFAQAYPVKH
jgi:hypothetical protein